jgi:superfamily II DNA/RNA helicase
VTNFTSLGLEPRLLKALTQEGYETPTPIQTQAIPHVLQGKDLLGIAQTGTGKTASFALPILQRLMENTRAPHPKSTRALILSPTRELAAQIADSFKAYGRYMNFNIFWWRKRTSAKAEHGTRRGCCCGNTRTLAGPREPARRRPDKNRNLRAR